MNRFCTLIKSSFIILLGFLSFSLSAQDLSAMTYNIRLDHSGDGVNRWDNRKDQMIAQLKFYAPDIFGIQEGLPHQVSYLDSALAEYSYIGVGRDDGKQKGEFSAIYFNQNALELGQNGTFWLSLTPEEPSVGWDAALPRICTYGLFTRTGDGKQFWVFNTHFDHIGVQARVESMKVILEKIRVINQGLYPVILMGDLNVTPDEAPIAEMKKMMRDSREIAGVSFGPDATFNGFDFGKAPERRIDYIAVSDQIEVLKYAVLTDSFEQRYISDHFAVYCILKL